MRLLAALVALLISSLVLPAQAGCAADCGHQESAAVATRWSGDAKARTRLILASPSHAYGGPVWTAIEMDIAHGWFVYAPDTGHDHAAELEWSGSANMDAPVLRWPPPEKLLVEGKLVRVYRGHVVLPVSIGPIQPDGDILVGLRLNYAVCGEVCRPAIAVHHIRISAAPGEVPDAARDQAKMIAAALAEAEDKR